MRYVESHTPNEWLLRDPLDLIYAVSGLQGVQSLLRTSDKIEASKKQVHETEQVAKHVLVDLELQRAQMQDMKGMVSETSSATSQVHMYLQIIADRSYRQKVSRRLDRAGGCGS